MGALLCPVAVLLAAAAPVEKAPSEVKGIDATCKAAAKLDDARKLNARSLISDAILPEANDGRDKWRAFKTNEELRTYLEKGGAPNTSAWIWNAPDRTTIVGMYFQSDTGDWSLDVNYCFRRDGSLARLESKVNNLAGGDSGERVTYTRADGSVLFERAKAFDTDHKLLPDADHLDHPPLYPTVKSLPFLAPPGSAPPAKSQPDAGAAPDPDVGLDQAGVMRFVREHLADVKGCYERELARRPGLAGKVVMHWTIDASGVTHTIDMESNTLPTIEAGACLRDVIRKWRFVPAPVGGGLEVSFPFVFQSAGRGRDGGTGVDDGARRR